MQERDLFELTFDQQLTATQGQIDNCNIAPNRRIRGEIVFEPSSTGVRVTARDSEHRLLWGYVGSKETVKQIHCLVATYDTLQQLIGEELEKQNLNRPEKEAPMDAVKKAFEEIENTLKWLRESLDVVKFSNATNERALTIARLISDANRQISIEARTLKGMKSKTD